MHVLPRELYKTAERSFPGVHFDDLHARHDFVHQPHPVVGPGRNHRTEFRRFGSHPRCGQNARGLNDSWTPNPKKGFLWVS